MHQLCIDSPMFGWLLAWVQLLSNSICISKLEKQEKLSGSRQAEKYSRIKLGIWGKEKKSPFSIGKMGVCITVCKLSFLLAFSCCLPIPLFLFIIFLFISCSLLFSYSFVDFFLLFLLSLLASFFLHRACTREHACVAGIYFFMHMKSCFSLHLRWIDDGWTIGTAVSQPGGRMTFVSMATAAPTFGDARL